MFDQIDICVGDGNKMTSRYSKVQQHDDLENSSLIQCFRQAWYHLNTGVPLSRRVSMEFVDVNKEEDKRRPSDDAHAAASGTSFDCMFGVVVGWGKADCQKAGREDAQEKHRRKGEEAACKVVLKQADGTEYRDP